MNISVASICRQEEDLIRPWLEHLLTLSCIDSIYINDTGSTDATLDYISSYKDSRIHLYRSRFEDFSTARNFILSELKCRSPEWFMMLDIDELFSTNYEILFQQLSSKDFSSYQTIYLPHIKFYDFNKMWFHIPPTTPSWDGKTMTYSWFKDTTTIYHGANIGRFQNNLHETFCYSVGANTTFSLLRQPILSDLSDLQDDAFIIHYSKAKLHAQARRTGRSFEYCVGEKRRRYRLLKPAVTNGKLYDREWALKATDEDIEELGRNQLIQFQSVEGHCFPEVNFDVYNLNNKYIRKYYGKN